MKAKAVFAAFAAAAFLAFMGGASAQAPAANPPAPTINIRGTITAFDGKVLQVKDATGASVSIQVPDTLNVTVAKAFSLADIKTGMVLGVTTLTRPDGTVVALDVRPLGQNTAVSTRDYDLAPGSQMNNAKLDAIVAVAGSNGTELTLNYGTGTVKARITPQTTMSQAVAGARTDLKTGESVYVRARTDVNPMVATQVEVSEDGVKPGQQPGSRRSDAAADDRSSLVASIQRAASEPRQGGPQDRSALVEVLNPPLRTGRTASRR